MPAKKHKSTSTKFAASKKRATKASSKLPKPLGPFRFLDLPRELRDKIYKLALADKQHHVHFPLDYGLVTAQPGLILANKQIRKESLPIHYRFNSFFFDIHGLHLCNFFAWLDRVGPDFTRQMRKLTLSLHFHRSECITWSDPWKFVEACERSLSAKAQVVLIGYGQHMSLAPFHIACEMGKQMRNEGLLPEVVQSLLFKARQAVIASKTHCFCSDIDSDNPDDDDFFEYSDMEDGMSFIYSPSQSVQCKCVFCKAPVPISTKTE